MRNLYRELGFSHILANTGAIERRLSQSGLDEELVDSARFVLLSPPRKTKYDWSLGRALELAASRSSLGLPEDPLLPRDQLPFRRGIRRIPTIPLTPKSWRAWVGASALFLSLYIWVRSPSMPAKQGDLKATIPKPLGASPTPLPPDGEVRTHPAEEQGFIPFPDHGWLQVAPEVQLSVPWHIETDPGQGYLLTLIDAQSQVVLETIFLKGGEPYSGLVPEGSFELAYTSGTRWHDLPEGFGAKAQVVRPAITYEVPNPKEISTVWNLRLHPTSCEGVPETTDIPAPTTGDPEPSGAEQSL